MSSNSPTLVFDGDCAFCTACVRWGQRNLKQWPTTVAYQFIDVSEHGLTQEQVRTSIWLLPAKLPANRAVAAILKQQRNLFWKLLGVLIDLPILRLLSAAAYRLVARNRHRLPGATEACELPPR